MIELGRRISYWLGGELEEKKEEEAGP